MRRRVRFLAPTLAAAALFLACPGDQFPSTCYLLVDEDGDGSQVLDTGESVGAYGDCPDGYSDFVRRIGDCDDADPGVSPDLPERCGDGKDNDCDEAVDADDPEGCVRREAPGPVEPAE